MSGYSEYRAKMKKYKNKEYIGVTEGELISIAPVTIRVAYDGKNLYFTRFKSLVSFDNVTEEDIGNRYILEFDMDNQGFLLIGSVKYYEDYYSVGEEE